MNRDEIRQTAKTLLHIMCVIAVGTAIAAVGIAFLWGCYYAGIPM